MRKYLNLSKWIIIFPLVLVLAMIPFQSGSCCVNPGGICRDNPSEPPQTCCPGDNGEEYECKELTAGYFTCEKKETPPPKQ